VNDDRQSSVFGTSAGGVSGQHAETPSVRFLVAPATSSEQNTLRLRLIPIACWRVDDVRFAFNSSFVTADVTAELAILVRLREEHKDSAGRYPALSVFGHADPTGSDDYNKTLSGRRAEAVYAILISGTQASKAVSLWQQIAGAEHWGNDQRQSMLDVTGLPAGTSDGALYQAYFAKLRPAKLALTPQDFLAQGADALGKGDYQGCSRFNPLLIFSQDDQDRYHQAAQNKDEEALKERNDANASNRRVVVLLFRPGSVVSPTKWPCPRVSEDKAGCIARFWSDGEKRRSTHVADERRYEKTKDTFACRFYDRLSSDSPCEQHIILEDYPFSM
jgi:hypothetical protein